MYALIFTDFINFKMKRYFLLIIFSALIFKYSFAQNDSLQKAFNKEEKRFQKSLKKKPDAAETYWKHANNLSLFKGKYAKDAIQFYVKAIKIDSLNALLFKDYGKYLFNILKNSSAAKNILQKSEKLNPSDNEVAALLKVVTIVTDLNEKKQKMKDIGISKAREYQSNFSYASLTNFDSLKIFLSDISHKESYEKLLTRFLNDDVNISSHEMYLLLVGYSMLKDYRSLNYNDIRDLQGMASSEHYDGAINYALKLLLENPLNPSIYKELMFCYRMKNDTVNADKYLNKLKRVFDGMIYSGNGTCEKPYLNLWSKEKNNFIKYLGYTPTENFNIITCAGQMTEAIEVINPVTTQKEFVHFNISLMSENIIGK